MNLPSAQTYLILQTGRQQPLPSLQTLPKSQAGQTLGICLTIQTNLTLTFSLQKDRQAHPPCFLSNRRGEVYSLKLVGLDISHALSWANHISNCLALLFN